MKITRKTISNILFYGFIIFIFTPYGSGTRAKLTQGVTYVKTMIFAPKAIDIAKRGEISSLNLSLRAISNSSDFNLKDQKGKVILINYWATWCPPCRGEMPSLQSLYNDYQDKIVFAFITNDEKIKVDKFYLENNYKLPTFNMMSNPAPEISTRTLPTTFIIDKNGKIALKEVGASNWNSGSVRKMLDTLLEE
jgi:thiol-disulfide isomerase/thioredoxin